MNNVTITKRLCHMVLSGSTIIGSDISGQMRRFSNTKVCRSSDKPSPLTLWHCVDARSLRCLWAMEELGVKNYKLVTMPFPPRLFYKEYLKTNILGTVPFLQDAQHEMTESCGICQYLVSKYPCDAALAVQPSEPDFAAYTNWLFHADATLTFPQTIVLRYTKLEPGKCDIAADDYAKWYLARLRLLDSTLADGREFLVGNRFTIADICVGYALFLPQAFQLTCRSEKEGERVLLSDKFKPQTRAYLERLMQRSAFLRARELQSVSLKDFERSIKSQAHE